MNKFTILDFNIKYPSEDACIQEIFNKNFSHLNKCLVCGNTFKYYKVTGRKCYSCQYCSHQIHPLANTIFHKSETSIKVWFYAIFLFSSSKNGVSAKELERQLGVTYKCAWRIANKVRTLFTDDEALLKDVVELDETYIGGKE